MKKVYNFLLSIHLLVGIGAICGGLAAILNPWEPLGAPVDAIKNSPFENYLIPGMILFTIVGLGNLLGAVSIIFKSKFQCYISGVFSVALVIWIVVQVIMMNGIEFLHVLFFFIGVIGAILSAYILFKHRLFPTEMFLKYFKKIKGEM